MSTAKNKAAAQPSSRRKDALSPLAECEAESHEKKECKKEIKREDIFENICVLKNRLINNAVWNEDRTEVSWYTLELSSFGQTAWDI